MDPAIPKTPLYYAINAELNFLMSLTGASLCNIHLTPDSCEPLLKVPLAAGVGSATGSVEVVTTKEGLQNAMKYVELVPNAGKLLLLVPTSLLSTKSCHTMMKAQNVVHTFAKGSTISKAVSALLKRPSSVAAFLCTPSDLPTGTSHVLENPGIPPDLDMIFPASVYDKQGRVHTLNILFDSGSTHSFITDEVTRIMAVPRDPPCLKSVATVSGPSRVTGTVSMELLWGRPQRLLTVATLHALNSLVPGVDVILGQDWLRSNHVSLDYGAQQATIGHVKRHTLCSNRDVSHNQQFVHGSVAGLQAASTYCPSISTQEANASIKAGGLAFLLMVKPQTFVTATETLKATLASVPEPERARLGQLLTRYTHLFPEQLPPGLPPTKAACEVVPLEPGSRPPYRRHYRLSPTERAEIERQLSLLIEQGLVQPSSSPFGAPVLVVKKPHSSAFRIVFDYREINKLTIKNRWTIPRIQDLYDSFHGKTVYSSLDLMSAYHQLALCESDIPKTAFTCHLGSFEWRAMPEGLSNAPSVFSRTMAQILAPYIGKFVLVYLDDICILSSSIEEHYKHLELVFELLSKHRLVLKMTKCAFFKNELKYLGHIISAQGVRADPEKLSKIQQ